MTTLRDLLQRAADRGLSTRAMEAEVERAATASGAEMKLNRATASLILSGKYKSRASDSTVRAIAHLAGVPAQAAFAAADQPGRAPIPFGDEVPPEADMLSPKRRKVALELIRSLIEAEELEHMQTGVRISEGMTPDEVHTALSRIAELYPDLDVPIRDDAGVPKTVNDYPSDEDVAIFDGRDAAANLD